MNRFQVYQIFEVRLSIVTARHFLPAIELHFVLQGCVLSVCIVTGQSLHEYLYLLS